MKLPKCYGYKIETIDGTEYDCDGLHNESCEDCLVNYKNIGGLWNPEIGKKTNKLIAFIKYNIL